MLEPEHHVDEQLPRDDFLVPRGERLNRLTRFYTKAFEGRIFLPPVAARSGLELLSQGGSLIVLPDFFGDHHGDVLGRSIPVLADGPNLVGQQIETPDSAVLSDATATR